MSQISQNEQSLEDEQKEISKENQKITPLSQLNAVAKTTFQIISSHNWIPCIAIGAIALACNLFQIGKQSMWFDEILSVERARQSFPVLWQIIFATQPNMALYYIFLHFWLSLTSLLGLNPTELVVRFPSAVFAALSSMVIFLLGRRFLGFIAGFIAAALYLFNNLQLVYAQETRSYALQFIPHLCHVVCPFCRAYGSIPSETLVALLCSGNCLSDLFPPFQLADTLCASCSFYLPYASPRRVAYKSAPATTNIHSRTRSYLRADTPPLIYRSSRR